MKCLFIVLPRYSSGQTIQHSLNISCLLAIQVFFPPPEPSAVAANGAKAPQGLADDDVRVSNGLKPVCVVVQLQLLPHCHFSAMIEPAAIHQQHLVSHDAYILDYDCKAQVHIVVQYKASDMVGPTMRNVTEMYLSRGQLAALWQLEVELQKGAPAVIHMAYVTFVK